MAEQMQHVTSSKFAELFHNKYTAWIILTLSLVLTLSAAYMSYHYSRKVAEQRFNTQVQEIANGIEYRMKFYEQVLWGGVGLFNSSENVARKEFKIYVESMGIQERLPGIQGIGYSIPVSREAKAQHVVDIRSEGYPDYDIKPAGERDMYSAIIYLEPFDWRNQRAFGYDMWSNDMRRAAMERARDSAQAATSGIITLVQETEQNVQRGFLMYLPVYQGAGSKPPATVAERRQRFKGWVYSPFRAGDLMQGVAGSGNQEYAFELYDGDEISEASLLYDSDNEHHLTQKNHRPAFATFIPLNMQGRTWQLYFHSTPNSLSVGEEKLPLLIGVFGFLIDVILFVVIFSLHRSQKRARQLAAMLEEQKEDLETVNKDLSQFAYITSHDLQEPLRTVSNCAGLLLEDYQDQFDEDGKYLLNTTVKATSRMSALIHAILEYSRLGKLGSDLETIDCNALIEEVRNDLAVLVEENNGIITCDQLPAIEGNRVMIKQLFANLISNGIKYRKAGEPPVVKVAGYERSGYFVFEVIDNGIGIEEKYRERIFQIFQRLHNADEYTGTGIGLSSCKKIVELHGGRIEVESEVDKGSIFKFTIKKR